MVDARAFWVTAPGHGELRPLRVAEAGPEQVLVRTLYSAISRGTESLVFSGRVPPAEYERMRAPHQAGQFPAPVKYGYCNVGRVEEGPDELRGRAVFCLYPHQTHYTVPIASVMPIPEEVPTARAVLAANMETAINGLWDAAPNIGDRVCVIGAGVVGCLVAHLARQIAGSEVQLVDIDGRKREVARRLGLDFALPAEARAEVDLVIHTSGSPAGLRQALDLAGREATIVEMSWYGDRPVELSLGGAFHSRRLKLVSSQVGTLPASQRARWSYRRRLELSLRLLSSDAYDALFAVDAPFEELPRVMAEVADPTRFVLCQRVVYG